MDIIVDFYLENGTAPSMFFSFFINIITIVDAPSTLRQRSYVKSSTIVDFTSIHTIVNAETSTPRDNNLEIATNVPVRGVDVLASTLVCMKVKSTIVDDFTYNR